MSEILVTTIRHESATTDTLTLGADGSLTINGNASLNGSAVVTESTGVTSVNGQTGAVTISSEPPTGLGEIGTNIIGIKNGYYSGGLSFDFGTTYSSVYVARPHSTSSWSLMPGTWRALGGTQGYFSGINSNQHLGLFVRVS